VSLVQVGFKRQVRRIVLTFFRCKIRIDAECSEKEKQGMQQALNPFCKMLVCKTFCVDI